MPNPIDPLTPPRMQRRGKKYIAAAILLMCATTLSAQRPVHTYSIVARDSATGQLGVAVQSHWFSVGSSVTWAEAGVGAIATQSFIDPSYGALGLNLLRVGKTADEVLRALIAGLRSAQHQPTESSRQPRAART